MLSNEQIKSIINECAKANHQVNVRDVSYCLLSMQLEDSFVAYKSLFGNDYDYSPEYHNTYDQTSAIVHLRTLIEFKLTSKKKVKTTEDISFEENKEYMLNLKRQTEEAMAAGEIDKKDGLKILTDISVKLNDKFNVSDSSQEQIVQVATKFNAICECGKEIYIPTKGDLMIKYNLVEKNE